jgi:hypothetical protein
MGLRGRSKNIQALALVKQRMFLIVIVAFDYYTHLDIH